MQPDRKLRAKALAKEYAPYGPGGSSHTYLDGSSGWLDHDWKGLEFERYPDHQKTTLKWTQVEQYIDLMIQSDRYLTDEEKEQRATRQEASNYNVGDEVVVDLPTRTIEGTIGYVGETDVRIDTSAHGQSWDNIHGKSLLSGNAYCGHCGAKLELTSSRKWRKLADGSLDDTLRVRYTCYGKLRKQTECTGQTGYTVHILDEIIDKAVRQIFSKMRGIPKEQIVTKRYEKENAERKNHLQALQAEKDKAEKDLLALKAEILACIKGESVLPRETLAEMITEQEEKLTELEALCESASDELVRKAELMDNVSKLYDELISYADLYDSANFEAKKMIVNQLIRRVDVCRGYQINISFNFDLTPYIEGE